MRPLPLRTFCVATLAALMPGPAAAQTAEEIARIEAAAPEKASVEPKQPRKVLVFSLAKGFKHASIPHGEKAFEILGKKTGAFGVTVTQDPTAFEYENLKGYDAVIFCNTTGNVLPTAGQREALQRFVENGKGLAGVHAATDTCYEWHTYGRMMGGYFDGHPWNAGDTVTLRIEDTSHPVMAAFTEPHFTIRDEIYQFREPYTRTRLNVLSSLDTGKTDMTKPGIRRHDGDFPVSWVQRVGKGRVFYCSLGHNPDTYWNPTVLKHYLDGIQYVLGDLEADDTPDAPVTAEYLLQTFPRVLSDVTETTWGETRGDEGYFDDLVAHAFGFPEARREFCRQMAGYLRESADNTTLTLAPRQFVAARLGRMATEANVPELAPLLRSENPDVVDLARTVLEKIPGAAAGHALRSALPHAAGEARIGIINSLGIRGDSQSVAQLGGLLSNKEPRVAEAAAAALGRIATPEAARLLGRAAETAAGPVLPAVVDARLRCADRLLETGDVEKAVPIYREIYEASLPSTLRVPAFVGLVRATGEKGLHLALREALSEDEALRSAAVAYLHTSDVAATTQQVIDVMRVAPAPRLVALLDVLSVRGERAALAAVREKVSDGREEVRLAALKALGTLGDGTVVPLLARKAATGSPEERETARTSLAVLGTADADRAILAALEKKPGGKKSGAVREELVKAAGVRRSAEALPVLLKTAGERDAGVSAESFRALAEIAGPEQADELVSLLLNTKGSRPRKEAEKAVLSSVRRIEDEEKRPEPLLKALSSAEDVEASASIVRLLGELGGEKVLDRLRELHQEGGEEKLQDAVVRALCAFPTHHALPDVREVARSSENQVHQALAVRAYARLVAQPSERASSQTLAWCREALSLARSDEDKRIVLGELAASWNPGVMQIVLPYLEEEALREDAVAAVVKLAGNEKHFAPQETKAALEQVKKVTSSDEQRKGAEEILKGLEKSEGYIAGWRLAGPFTSETRVTELAGLLDEPFAPEDASETTVTWINVLTGGSRDNPEMVDLGKALGGDSRVAYLRVRVWSPDETTSVLELGSDDGLKAWLNGSVIYMAEQARPYAPATDKVDVTLKQGWNHLMLKVAQQGGRWGASARFVRDGKPTEDLRLDASEVEETALYIAPAEKPDTGTKMASRSETIAVAGQSTEEIPAQ